ncbi:lipase family protein [Nocardia gipuzkoensis]|uniref:lipase family protein n=1 Tax=Nocardia gipuzkoensis TaxID=2749991 RepID=UPI0015EF34C0|nr:lipase family protein [Nocardia gipuzkoensis]
MYRPSRCLVAVVVLFCAAVGCGDTEPEPRPARGEIVSTTSLLSLPLEQTAALLADGGIRTPVRNGVDAFRVDYRTITPEGEPTTASGLVVLPRTEAGRLRVVSYEHGTMTLKSDAPSVDTRNLPDRLRAVMFAAAGYAATAPDYLGLGTGPGPHPYTHAPSEVSASADLLRAAQSLAARQRRELDPNVLVTGFSQGGHAAMALGKALQAGTIPGFGVAALAPISGPYDIRQVQAPAALDGRVVPGAAVLFLSYWITSMNRIHQLYDDPTEAFQQPYADKVEELFDGFHNEITIVTSLATTPGQLLTARFLGLAADPTGAAAKAIADSDGTCDWTPRVPVQLYASRGDRAVPYANTEHCLRALASRNATLRDVGEVDHAGTARVALPEILSWFQQQFPPS